MLHNPHLSLETQLPQVLPMVFTCVVGSHLCDNTFDVSRALPSACLSVSLRLQVS